MELAISPYDGAGAIRFGMSVDEVRRTIGKSFSSFFKTQTSPVQTDAFDSEGIHVHYKSPGVCEAVEMAAPACPTLNGELLVGRPYEQVSSLIKSLDSEVKEDEAGVTAFGLGIGLYAPSAAKDPRSPVESVIVFEKGYYD
jgi:hypothetical protein